VTDLTNREAGVMPEHRREAMTLARPIALTGVQPDSAQACIMVREEVLQCHRKVPSRRESLQ
jgi:hypothetical protein